MPPNGPVAAITIAAAIILTAIIALGYLYPLDRARRAARRRGRHRPPPVHVRIRAAVRDPAAEAWVEPMRPDRSLAGLRLRRDLRRWIRTSGVRKLP